MKLCLECAECTESYGPAAVAVRKAVKRTGQKLRRQIRQQIRQQLLQQKLLYAIKNKDSDKVLRILRFAHKDGPQAGGTDKNGHPFVVHANSAYRYDANPPRVLAKCQDVTEDDVYRILTSRVTEEKKPRIIDVVEFGKGATAPPPP